MTKLEYKLNQNKQFVLKGILAFDTCNKLKEFCANKLDSGYIEFRGIKHNTDEDTFYFNFDLISE